MADAPKKISVPWITADARAATSGWSMLTAYDYPSARLADTAGVDLVLVGDSVAMVVLGHADTLSVTMDEMLHHVKAARRGTSRALLVADMPYGSFHLGPRAGGRERAALRQGGRRAGGEDRGRAHRRSSRARRAPRSR